MSDACHARYRHGDEGPHSPSSTKVIFLTGMSGTGKSTVVALAELGYMAVDLDHPTWSMYDEDGDWIWREVRVEPRLRQVAEHEIDTRAPLDAVVAAVLEAISASGPAAS